MAHLKFAVDLLDVSTKPSKLETAMKLIEKISGPFEAATGGVAAARMPDFSKMFGGAIDRQMPDFSKIFAGGAIDRQLPDFSKMLAALGDGASDRQLPDFSKMFAAFGGAAIDRQMPDFSKMLALGDGTSDRQLPDFSKMFATLGGEAIDWETKMLGAGRGAASERQWDEMSRTFAEQLVGGGSGNQLRLEQIVLERHWLEPACPPVIQESPANDHVVVEHSFTIDERMDAAQRIEVYEWIDEHQRGFARRCEQSVKTHKVTARLYLERVLGGTTDELVLRLRCDCGNERNVPAWPALRHGGGGRA